MLRFLTILLVLAVAGTGAYYYANGRLPWVALAPEVQQVSDLREEFGLVRQQWKQAGRAAGLGIDASSIADSPLGKLEHLEKALAELAPRLKTPEARSQATQLRQDIALFKSEMR